MRYAFLGPGIRNSFEEKVTFEVGRLDEFLSKSLNVQLCLTNKLEDLINRLHHEFFCVVILPGTLRASE